MRLAAQRDGAANRELTADPGNFCRPVSPAFRSHVLDQCRRIGASIVASKGRAVATDELQAAYEQLRKIGKNNDGKIEETEIKIFRETRMRERIDDIFTAMDRNRDGKIAKDETRGLWTDDFGQLDKNSDGMLDRQEVENACMMRSGDKLKTPTPASSPPKK